MESKTVNHTIEPIFNKHSEVLILGTIPSPKSREIGFYYGNPQNRFWKVLAALFDEPLATTNEQRTDQLLRHHIALWDVLASCEIKGAKDTSIQNPKANDLLKIVQNSKVKAVFCTGAKATQLYRSLCEKEVGIPCVQLPSTSPANAAWNLERLIEAYRVILPHLSTTPIPTLPVNEVVALEQAIAKRGTSLSELMQRAGRWLAYIVHKEQPEGKAVILCGNGNNGGDGWVAAKYLVEWGHDVTIICSKDPHELKAQPALSAALEVIEILSHGSTKERFNVLVAPKENAEIVDELKSAAIIIDAILGTGFAGETIKEPFGTWIALANKQHERGTFTAAADIPSGLNANTGFAASPTVKADKTVTMICKKPGLFAQTSEEFCGTVSVASLANIQWD